MNYADSIDAPGTDLDRDTRIPPHRQIPMPLLALAYGLVGFGVLVLGTVLSALYATFQDPVSNKFVAKLTQDFAAKPLVVSGDGTFSIMLGTSAAELIALLIFVLMAGMASVAGTMLVQAGVHVVAPQFNYQMVRLKKRMDELVASVRSSVRPIVRPVGSRPE